jgi:hypothetical protein
MRADLLGHWQRSQRTPTTAEIMRSEHAIIDPSVRSAVHGLETTVGVGVCYGPAMAIDDYFSVLLSLPLSPLANHQRLLFITLLNNL